MTPNNSARATATTISLTLFAVILLPMTLLFGLIKTDSLSVEETEQYEYATEQTPFAAKPMDWPFWRGPEMNGVSRETNIVTKWNPRGGKDSNLLWAKKELAGQSTPIVMNGKLYTITRDQPETKQEGEKVVCLDAVTGKLLWENRFNVFQSDVPDTRVAWSSVVGDPKTGHVFVLGVCGFFQCLDGNTGRKIWSHSLSEEYGLLSTYGGRTNFPVVHGNLVIISAVIIGWGDMAKPAHRFIAFDKRNGQSVWFEGTRLLPFDTTYSSPVFTVINGQPAMIFGSGDGAVHAFQPQTGKKIWSHQLSPKRGLHVTPLVVGNHVFTGHAEENTGDTTMGAMICLDLATGKKVWKQTEWLVGKSSPIHINGRIYAAENGGNLRIIDAKTGKLIKTFRLRGSMHASPIYADGKIYIGTITGWWWVLQPTETGVKVLAKQHIPDGEMYGSPIVSHGRLYIPTMGGLYCVGHEKIGDAKQKPSANKRPAPPKEADITTDQQPAHLQIAPAESLLKNGQRQQLQVRIYNSRGQFLRMADMKKIQFTVSGPGHIDSNGKYHSPDETVANWNQPAAVRITATLQASVLSGREPPTGKARLRLVPTLPWNVDFNDGKIPETWVGIRYRHIPIDYKLYKKLAAKSLPTARLYIAIQTAITNGQPGNKTGKIIYNNNSPRRTLAALMSYLRLTSTGKPQTVLDPLLKTLTDEKIIGKHAWSVTPNSVTQLAINKGTRKISDGGAMVKIATIPKGQRSQGWMGHPHFTDYTIQADVLGAERVNTVERAGKQETIRKMPDMGIAGQRYVLKLMGEKQQLQIITWHAQPERCSKTVPFAWKANVWYTIKLRVTVTGNETFIQAKCWERDKQKEPAIWMLAVTDETPNFNGSPGLFGDASNAEIFYDNINVQKN